MTVLRQRYDSNCITSRTWSFDCVRLVYYI